MCCTVLAEMVPIKRCNAKWIDFERRLNSTFSSVEYFIYTYPHIFPDMNLDMLMEQYLEYQLLSDDEIPESIMEEASTSNVDREVEQAHTEHGHCRVDIIWGFLRTVKKPGTSEFQFDLLFKVAEAVMTIPHSNAGEERIFSLVNKNKTPSRSSLALDGTLSSLIMVKTHIENPLDWKPSETLLKNAKRATIEYNEKHKRS